MTEPDHYTTQFERILESEQEHLRKRHCYYFGEEGAFDPERAAGLAISGGGVRSATFALGALQSLIREDVAKHFAYLSTVSGGGYLGSCISSLLSWHGKASDGEGGHLPVSMKPEESPFVGLNVDDLEPSADARLGVRNQLHHLRTHGEYLAPHRRGITSLDIQRVAGGILSGIAHHFLLFALLLFLVASLSHLLLRVIDHDLSLVRPAVFEGVETGLIGTIGTGVGDDTADENGDEGSLDLLGAWWSQHVKPTYQDIRAEGADCGAGPAALVSAVLGLLWSLAWVGLAWFFGGMLNDRDTGSERPPEAGEGRWARLRQKARPIGLWLLGGIVTRAGWTETQHAEDRFTRVFDVSTGLVILAAFIGLSLHFKGREDFEVGLFLPLAFGIGGLGAVSLVNVVIRWRSRMSRRSLTRAVQGGVIYAVLFGAVLPVAVVVVFRLSELEWPALLAALGGLVLSYVFRARGLHALSGASGNGLPRFVISWGFPLLIAFSVLVLFSFASWAITAVATSAAGVDGAASVSGARLWGSAALSFGALIVLGYLVNANRVSPHYFYRDRLTEAYLQTAARVRRTEGDRQGYPLELIRNDENLKLSELSNGDEVTAPYHLIVTALNLAGSKELNRRTMLSEHFILSKHWVGSRITGYVKTGVYRNGSTRLGRAMTVSGAAAAPAAGQLTSAWWAFLLTLFNVRLGFWMDNPWAYRKEKGHRSRSWYFWPRYLFRELTGAVDARGEIVNLSDGGHTGDNLGLVPLLDRRCRVIFVLDGEADRDHELSSFNNAVRMAYIEKNIRIDIDLRDLQPDEERSSRDSVKIGFIEYPPERGLPKARGVLVYLKSSLADFEGRPLPVHVRSYAEGDDHFPHQSTGDQFFDDAQFESYRALGEHVGLRAVEVWRECETGLKRMGV